MNNLPPIRKKIYLDSLKIILIFGITSILLNVITIFSAINITPNFREDISIDDIKRFQDNTKFLKIFAIGESFVFAFLSLLGSFIIADRLSNKIAEPLKSITGILRSKPQLGQKIEFPTPSALEFRALIDEFTELWNRLCEAEKGNIEKFKKQNQELETILSSVEDAVMVIDSMAKVSQINQRMCRILNVAEEVCIDKDFDDLPTISDNYLKMRELVETHHSLGNHVFQINTENGKVQFYSGRLKTVLDFNNKPLSKVILLHDITEIRLRNNLRTECTLELSHELQKPLLEAFELINALKSEVATQVGIEQRLKQTLSKAMVLGNRLEQINYLNDESFNLNPQPYNLDDFLNHLISALHPLAQEKEVILTYSSSGQCVANFDIEKFSWVMKNLVLTCLRNAPQDSTITVRLEVEEHGATIHVADKGPDHTHEIQKHLEFKKLTDLGDEFHIASQTGLWLNISRRITQALHGSISFSYSLTTGNQFTISLPILNT